MSITELSLVLSSSVNPYENLAREEALLHACRSGQMFLYLWQNQNTVVIGRNQSALKECRIQQLEADGGHLARRLSGGGAVYHDLGNLNFTFVSMREDFDLARQTAIIQDALASFGIAAEFSGRNDLLLQGRKFSGSAYYYSSTSCYHHGTLMVDVDLDRAVRYLNVSAAKLRANGVSSVRSRIINLREADPDLTVERLKQALIRAWEKSYGLQSSLVQVPADPGFYASRAWLYRKEAESSYERSEKYPFGEVTIRFSLQSGKIAHAAVFTDAMTDDFSDSLQQVLEGLVPSEAASAIRSADLPHREELAQMMEEIQ